MNRNEIFFAIVEAARAVDDRIDAEAMRCDDTPFTVYGITSLTQLRMLSRLEDRFGIAISDGDAFRASSALRLVDMVEQKAHLAGGRPRC